MIRDFFCQLFRYEGFVDWDGKNKSAGRDKQAITVPDLRAMYLKKEQEELWKVKILMTV